MAKFLSVRQAAKAGHCSTTTIRQLCNDGLITFTRATATSPRVIEMTRDEVRDLVMKHKPRSGFKAPRTNGSTPTPGALKPVLEMAALGAEKLAILIALGQRCSEQELQLLLDLTDKK